MIPRNALIIPIGVAGSGKSTLMTRKFGAGNVVSSDHCRELVCGDENRQDINKDAFELFHDIIDRRLRLNVLTVADATNLRPSSRKALVDLAKKHGRPVVYVVLDVSLETAVYRNGTRSRVVPVDAIHRQHQLFEQQRKLMYKEVPHVVTVDWQNINDPALMLDMGGIPVNNLWVIGDVHSCDEELEELLAKLPKDAEIAFVGDFTDRGPHPKRVLKRVSDMIRNGRARATRGNHDWKLYRAVALGRSVTTHHGLQETLDAGVTVMDVSFIGELPTELHYVLPGGYHVYVCHAGIPFQDREVFNKRTDSHRIYGETDGDKNPEGFPNRTYRWADTWKDDTHICVFGHTPVHSVSRYGVGNCINVDTGCAFGGKLTAYNVLTGEVLEVEAKATYCER